MEPAVVLLALGGFVFSAYLFAYVFERYQIADILFFVALGVVLGPVTGLIDPTAFGRVGELFATCALLIILFEAGLGIRVKSLLQNAGPAAVLMLLTLLSSIAVVWPIATYGLDLSPVAAIALGILLSGVSFGMVVPLAKRLPVSQRTRDLLALEANFNDVVVIGLVLAVLDVAGTGVFDLAQFTTALGGGLLIALLVGGGAALAWSQLLRHLRDVQNNIFMTPALVLVLFGLTELLGGSGIFAAFAFGITLGNLQYVPNLGVESRRPAWLRFREFSLTKWERHMFSGLVFLLKSCFFVYIGLFVGVDNLPLLFWGFITALLLLAARVLVVWGVVRDRLPAYDVQVMYRLIPKGLVGAAIITLLDNPAAQEYTYAVILFCIILTSAFLFMLPAPPKEEEAERDLLKDITRPF